MANDPSVDNNKMAYIMFVSHLLKTLKLIFIILNISYFVGLGWLTMCRIIESSKENVSLQFDISEHRLLFGGGERDDHVDDDDSIFIGKFKLSLMSQNNQALAAMYFAFTSLSTVGFGDFYPVSDVERIIGAMVLMFGVAIFLFIMGKFIEMIQ